MPYPHNVFLIPSKPGSLRKLLINSYKGRMSFPGGPSRLKLRIPQLASKVSPSVGYFFVLLGTQWPMMVHHHQRLTRFHFSKNCIKKCLLKCEYVDLPCLGTGEN